MHDHTPNSYVFNQESTEEMARRRHLDQMTTRAMGGPLAASTIPCLHAPPLTQAVLAPLSHRQRRVLLLVNGQRSLHDIATLLRTTPEEVQKQLRQLAQFVDL